MNREEALIEEAELTEAISPKDKLRKHFLKKGYNGVLAFGRLFKVLDHDSSGTLSVDETKKAIGQAGLDLSDEEIADLLQEYDVDGEGTINYNEFLAFTRPEMNEARMEIVKEAFETLDESGNEAIALEDLKDKFDASNHPNVLDGGETEEEVMNRFVARFEECTSNGKVTLQEFMDYYSVVSKSIEDDNHFIQVVKSSWGLQ